MQNQRVKIEWVTCHRKPERSFFWRGKQFPVCARCTGIYIGYLSLILFVFNVFYLNIWWTIALILPTCIDGLTQAYCNRESNNTLRFITGVAAGVGIMSLTNVIGRFLGYLILLIFNHLF
ncbi:MAG: DUF2085 domain-containing protein [Dysgonomonas sp.]